MTSRQAPRSDVAQRLLSAVAVLVLGALVHPALAATGSDASCYQPIDAPPMSPSAEPELSISIVNHGSPSTPVTSHVPHDVDNDAHADLLGDMTDGEAEPRVEAMLQRIFDEAEARQTTFPEPEQRGGFSAPFAVDKSDSAEEPAAVLDTNTTEGTAELPDFGAEELLRYRQQMYRKDI